MNKHIAIIAVLVSFISAVHLYPQFPPSDWTKVSSHAVWLNSYNELGLMTLKFNGIPLMKKMRPGSIFGPTKFPAGNYNVECIDSRTGKSIHSFPFSLADDTRTLLITSGDDKSGMKVFEFSSAHQSASGKLILANAFARGTMTAELSDGVRKVLPPGEFVEVSIAKDMREQSVTVALTTSEGGTRSEKVSLSSFSETGGIVVFHCDEIEQQKIRFSVFDFPSLQVITADGTEAVEN